MGVEPLTDQQADTLVWAADAFVWDHYPEYRDGPRPFITDEVGDALCNCLARADYFGRQLREIDPDSEYWSRYVRRAIRGELAWFQWERDGYREEYREERARRLLGLLMPHAWRKIRKGLRESWSLAAFRAYYEAGDLPDASKRQRGLTRLHLAYEEALGNAGLAVARAMPYLDKHRIPPGHPREVGYLRTAYDSITARRDRDAVRERIGLTGRRLGLEGRRRGMRQVCEPVPEGVELSKLCLETDMSDWQTAIRHANETGGKYEAWLDMQPGQPGGSRGRVRVGKRWESLHDDDAAPCVGLDVDEKTEDLLGRF
jgi:hypothetical protein